MKIIAQLRGGQPTTSQSQRENFAETEGDPSNAGNMMHEMDSLNHRSSQQNNAAGLAPSQ